MTARSWLITNPTWGARCVEHFIKYSLPSIRAALEFSGSRARFLIHTDSEAKLRPAMAGLDVEFRPVAPGKTAHHSLGHAHRDAVGAASHGEAIAILCSDMLVSREAFGASEKQFATGKRVIMGAATRTFNGIPKPGMKSRDLLSWTMDHRHPSIKECFWGTGRSLIPWAVYFQKGQNIVLRGLHLHPFAAVKDREIKFSGVTSDFDLVNAFDRDEVHVVTDADEMAMAEMSPADRTFPNGNRPFDAAGIAHWARGQTIDIHRWMFRERPIVIKGELSDCGDHVLSEDVIRRLMAAPDLAAARRRGVRC